MGGANCAECPDQLFYAKSLTAACCAVKLCICWSESNKQLFSANLAPSLFLMVLALLCILDPQPTPDQAHIPEAAISWIIPNTALIAHRIIIATFLLCKRKVPTQPKSVKVQQNLLKCNKGLSYRKATVVLKDRGCTGNCSGLNPRLGTLHHVSCCTHPI